MTIAASNNSDVFAAFDESPEARHSWLHMGIKRLVGTRSFSSHQTCPIFLIVVEIGLK